MGVDLDLLAGVVVNLSGYLNDLTREKISTPTPWSNLLKYRDLCECACLLELEARLPLA